MTTWTMEQVKQAKRLRASVVVDPELVHLHGEEVLREAEAEMAKALTRMGHPLGLELSTATRECYTIEWATNPANPFHLTGTMRWNPSTNTAELRGGHLDGKRYAIRTIGDALRVPRPTTLPFIDHDENHTSAEMVEMADTYELVGWREDEHVWVYEAKTRR